MSSMTDRHAIYDRPPCSFDMCDKSYDYLDSGRRVVCAASVKTRFVLVLRRLMSLIVSRLADVDKLCGSSTYLTAGFVECLSVMSSRSARSSASEASSISSSATMTQAAPQSSHPYLTPGRASTISTWQSRLCERQSQSQISSEAEEESRRAAVEAYQQMRMALFAKARVIERRTA